MISIEELRSRLRYYPDTGEFIRVDCGRPCATVRWGGRQAGTVSGNGYVLIGVNGVARQAHRLAWLWMTGHWPTQDIDHIDGNRTNNRWPNLRQVSRQTNLQNQRQASRNSQVGLLGVSRKRDKFEARIMVDRKTIRLGTFDTPELAHEAYLRGKRQLHPGNTL